jgi:hypothetical protein
MEFYTWFSSEIRQLDPASKKVLERCRSPWAWFVARIEAGVAKDASPTRRTTMRVMVIVKATKNSEASKLPDTELLEAMGKYNEELVKAGVMLAGEGLKASSFGKRVEFKGSKRNVVDGPFSETKELVAGFWLWQVKSMEEAVEWAKRCPNPMPGEEGVLELRQVFEAEDFAPVDPTGEFREREAMLREQTSKR